MLAAYTANTEVVRALLDHGADSFVTYVPSMEGPTDKVASRRRVSELALEDGYPPGKEGTFAWLMKKRIDVGEVRDTDPSDSNREAMKRIRAEDSSEERTKTAQGGEAKDRDKSEL